MASFHHQHIFWISYILKNVGKWVVLPFQELFPSQNRIVYLASQNGGKWIDYPRFYFF